MLVSLAWSMSISGVILLRPPCPAVFSGPDLGEAGTERSLHPRAGVNHYS